MLQISQEMARFYPIKNCTACTKADLLLISTFYFLAFFFFLSYVCPRVVPPVHRAALSLRWRTLAPLLRCSTGEYGE